MSASSSKQPASANTLKPTTGAASTGTQLSPHGSARPAIPATARQAVRELASGLRSGPLSDAPALMIRAERALAAAKPEWIGARVEVLLSHFYQPTEESHIAKGRALDWIRALGHLPQWATETACRKWLDRADGKRPTPGQIKALAEAETFSLHAAMAEARARMDRSQEKPRGDRSIPADLSAIIKGFGA